MSEIIMWVFIGIAIALIHPKDTRAWLASIALAIAVFIATH